MIESIERSMAVASMVPSAGRSIARRQKRLKWLSSLREALDGAGSAVDEGRVERPVDPRARIADALSAVDEIRAQLRAGADDGAQSAGGGTTTAAELAARIAAAADLSVLVQARISPASVLRLVGATR